MYKSVNLTDSLHAQLIRLRNGGRITSISSFVQGAVIKALEELPAPQLETAPANEIVITIQVNGGQIS